MDSESNPSTSDASEEPPGTSAQTPAPPSRPTTSKNPLRQFSLRGRADELEAMAADTKPLFGEFAMHGQATMLYAEPGTGKTLLLISLCLQAIEMGRIDPNNLYYVNADDNSAGLAVKLRLLQDVGAHMLAPGYEGLKTDSLVDYFTQAIEAGSARGTCVIIDTLKKFSDLMDKKRTSAFAQVCRQYVMAGGTVVALGHTAKNPNADGTPRYQGTTDILEDFDAVYMAQPLVSKGEATQRLVKLTRLKSRAESPEIIAYAYDVIPGLSYESKLASIHSVHPDDLDGYAPEVQPVNDPLVMDAIVRLIKGGCLDGKMAISKAVAKETGVSQRQAMQVLERYTGNTPRDHLWAFERGHRGVRHYRLIDQSTDGA